MKSVIKKWGINGEGIVFRNKKPVFIVGAIPTERVSYHIVQEHKTYCIGELEKVEQESSLRRYPVCQYADRCSGCSLMHVKYKGQCKMKEQILKESLKKYAQYDGPIAPIRKNINNLGYRNSCKLPLRVIQGKLVSGMYKKNSNDFVAIDHCLIHSKYIEHVRKQILEVINNYGSALDKTLFKSLVIKEFNEKIQVILVSGPMDFPQKLIDQICNIEGIVSLWQSIKTDRSVDVFGSEMKHLALEMNITLNIEDLQLSLLPRSFFQLNTTQAVEMYKYVSSLVDSCNLLVEAYCGIGAMSLFCAKKVKQVIGIEYIDDAIKNAKENAKINHIKNASFICGDAGQVLRNISKDHEIDTLIVDPPRTGLDRVMIDTILSSNIKNIIYVSCNPSTLAKNIDALNKRYHLVQIQPFDLFSQTQHIETVCLFKRS